MIYLGFIIEIQLILSNHARIFADKIMPCVIIIIIRRLTLLQLYSMVIQRINQCILLV